MQKFMGTKISEIIAENIPNMMKSIYLPIPIVQPIPSRINRESHTQTPVKCLKLKTEKSLPIT